MAKKKSAAQAEAKQESKLTTGQIIEKQTVVSAGKSAKTAKATLDHSTIATRAFEIWASEGYVHGRAEEHWLRAESELKAR